MAINYQLLEDRCSKHQGQVLKEMRELGVEVNYSILDQDLHMLDPLI